MNIQPKFQLGCRVIRRVVGGGCRSGMFFIFFCDGTLIIKFYFIGKKEEGS